MAKMWEYYEGRTRVKIWDFPKTKLGSEDEEELLDRQDEERLIGNRRQRSLNSMGIYGWELIATRYVVDRTSEEGGPVEVTFHDTFKREINSGISVRDRRKEISEEYRSEIDNVKNPYG